MAKINISATIAEEVIYTAKAQAKADNRSFSNYIETAVKLYNLCKARQELAAKRSKTNQRKP